MSLAADTAHNELKGDLLELSHLVDPSEIIAATSAEYADNSEPWSTARNKHPRLVLRPKTLESLSKVVTFLATTDLDYKVRSGGYGSASATDVLISLSAFDDFEFNEDERYVILGAGATWRSYYERMEKVTSDWTVVGARSPCLGIGGSTLSTGFSWLSSEYGTVSDPSNLLDVRIITADGQIKWASSDPELFWAMRGTEGGFAIATHFKFRAHYFPENGKIWAGPIMIPRDKATEVAKGIMSMVEADRRGEISPKTAIFLYVLRKDLLGFIGAKEDMLIVHAYDGRGQEKGREAFKWALDIDGATDQTRGDMTIAEVSKMQDGADALRGKSETNWSPLAITTNGTTQLTEEVLLKAFTWWTSMLSEPNSIAENGWLLLELFCCRDSITGRHSNAWPRPEGFKHMILLGTGCAPDSNEETRERARKYIVEGPEKILGKKSLEVDVTPNAIDSYHSIERIYGEHYGRLRRVKGRVDPGNRLKGWIEPQVVLDRGHVDGV